MLKINDASNFRRTVAGLCLIAAPLGLIASEVMYFVATANSEGGTGDLVAIAERPGLWMAATFIGLAAAILFIPAAVGAVHAIRGRGVVLGHVGGALALVGAVGYACHQTLFVMLGEMAQMEGQREAIIAVSNQLDNSVAIGVLVMLMFIISFFVGWLLLMIGLYRVGVAPAWAPIFILLSILPDFFLPQSSDFVEYAGYGLLLAAFGVIGVRILRMTDEEWERGAEAPVVKEAMVEPKPERPGVGSRE